MDFIKLTEDVVDEGEAINKVKSPSCGGISIFIGTTRDTFEGLQVTRLCYEAYESMASKIMKEICFEVRERWTNVVNIAIYHRLGEVGVGETSVVIAVSSPHRADCIAAVNFAINALKAKVPIWKKEEYTNEEVPSTWKENKEFFNREQI